VSECVLVNCINRMFAGGHRVSDLRAMLGKCWPSNFLSQLSVVGFARGGSRLHHLRCDFSSLPIVVVLADLHMDQALGQVRAQANQPPPLAKLVKKNFGFG
jgi:hypothetical protein